MTEPRFPGVELVAELGRGANTVVYRVRRGGAEYALKVLTSARAADEAAVTAFRREAAILGSLDHPGLPRIYEVGQAAAGPYLVLELIEGESLSEIIGDAPHGIAEDRVVRLALDIVGPLATAHRAGLVHRDLKPANVIVTADGRARLIDFGLAARGARLDDAAAGTFAYSSPEQTGMLNRPVDGRSDLYALGAVLYECLTGEPPYLAADVGELMGLHATAPVPDPLRLRPNLSPQLAAIVRTLLAKDPDDRYATAGDLLAALTTPTATPGPRDGTDGVLIGRAAEVGLLAARLGTASGGDGGGAVLIRGLPGAGKSRLAREVAGWAERDAQVVLCGKCEPDDPIPLSALRRAVEEHLRSVERLAGPAREAGLAVLRQAIGARGGLLRALSPALAALVDAPVRDLPRRADQFTSAVAAFLGELARAAGGVVLYLDDVQWLDTGSQQVLRRLAPELRGSSLLLLATARDDSASLAALGAFEADLGEALDTQVPLGPLGDDAVARLVAQHLGGRPLARALTDELAARTGGNPFTVVEYVRATINAGLVTPSWDGWRLDADGLGALELSGDAAALVLQRLDGLAGDSHRLLVAAASVGMRFDAELVARVCDLEPRRARHLLAEAATRRLVAMDGDRGTFVHDRIREALLADLPPAEVRGLHQRIAATLDAAGATDSAHVYALSRHYALGETERTPERVYGAGLAAGNLALAEHAPVTAVEVLERAGAVAVAAGLPLGAEFHQAMGISLLRNGRFADAVTHLEQALAGQPDRMRRAELLTHLANAHAHAWDPIRGMDAVHQGFAELRRPLPRNSVLLAATALLWFVAGLAVSITKIGFGTARGERREALQLQSYLYDYAAYCSVVGMRMKTRALITSRSLYTISRLGPCTEYSRQLGGFGIVANVMGLHRVARRVFASAMRVATDLGDPALVAYTEWQRGVGSWLGNADDGLLWRSALVRHDRWLDVGDVLTGVASVCLWQFMRGHTDEAQRWYEHGAARLAAGTGAEGAAFSASTAVIPAQFGHPAQAAARLEVPRSVVAANADNLVQRVNLLAAQMIIAVEQGEVGGPFEETAAEFNGLKMAPGDLLGEQCTFYVYEAMGRLAQCRQAASARERAAALHRARRAVRQLGRAAKNPVLRAHHLLAAADLELVSGRPAKALRRLAAAEVKLRLDAPLIEYEAARLRARAFTALGEAGMAERQARHALALAMAGNWLYRARWIRSEFGVGELPSPGMRSAGGSGRSSGGAVHQRRLAALQQVSHAAATVLDPDHVARIALDETVRILGAERAYLFLYDGRELIPHLGRDADGQDISELTGYGASLVERVRDTREALVVTGTEEGAALGSQSTLVHGLRSILIAPLQLDGRLLGIVYLDSRVAKGIFSLDDVGILTAITNHVAVSLETARAAQLEAAVRAAQRQLDVAETLRGAMAELTATLDPDEVLRRLLKTVTEFLPGEAAALLTRDQDSVVLAAAYGPGELMSARGNAVGTLSEPWLTALLDAGGPGAVTIAPGSPVAQLLGGPSQVVAIPVAGHGNAPGIVVIGSSSEGIDDPQIHVVAALVEQGMTAFDNAQLFRQVRRMATVDALSGLYNRAHFYAEASHRLELARRHRRPIATLMLDIDHFKRVNDTYGHLVGDEVIRTVAARLRESARDGDVLGRYGGEEFALLAPETGAAATAFAERLRGAVCASPVPTEAGPVAVTISVGVAHVDDGDGELAALLRSADEALYEAKRHGRNRVARAHSHPAGERPTDQSHAP